MLELIVAAALLSAPSAPAEVCTTALTGVADCSAATLGQPMHDAAARAATAGAATGALIEVTVGSPAPAPVVSHRAPHITAPLPGVYTVRHGDTLSAIAARVNYPGGWAALARDNGYLNPNRIYAGEQIIVARA